MSRDDRISNLFRDNQHKLEEHPSPAVWERIEARLDRHKGQSAGRVKILYRYAAVAAVIVLIVTMVGLFQLGSRQQQMGVASHESMPPVKPLGEETKAIAQLNEAREEAPQSTKQQKKPNGRSAVPAAPQARPTAPVEEEVKTATEETEEKIQKIEMQSSKPALRNRANEELSLDQVRVNNRRYAKPPTNTGNSAGISYREEGELAEIQDAEEDAVVESINVAPAAKAPSAASADRPKRKLLLRKQAESDYANRSDAFALSMHRKLRKLDWLLGTWKGSEGLEGESYEEWSLENENVLQGRGYHVIGGDKIFSERMRIVYMPDLKRVYYIMQAEYGGEELAFPLISATGTRMVFEQLDMPADEPTRVILERTDQGFRTIIENTNGELKANQQSYLQNRNHLSRYKAKRYLKRYSQ